MLGLLQLQTTSKSQCRTWRRFTPSLLLSALQGSHPSSVSSKIHSTNPFLWYLYICMWKGEDLEKNTLCVLNASTDRQQMPLLIFHWPKQASCLHSPRLSGWTLGSPWHEFISSFGGNNFCVWTHTALNLSETCPPARAHAGVW